MTEKHARIAFTAICLAACSLAAPAQSQDASTPRCPVEYWPFGSVCIHSVTGDVVSATENGCPANYWRLDDVCVDFKTGDVEMAEQRIPASGR